MFHVVFLNERGKMVTLVFDSPFKSRRFALKIEHSKKCTLISAEY